MESHLKTPMKDAPAHAPARAPSQRTSITDIKPDSNVHDVKANGYGSTPGTVLDPLNQPHSSLPDLITPAEQHHKSSPNIKPDGNTHDKKANIYGPTSGIVLDRPHSLHPDLITPAEQYQPTASSSQSPNPNQYPKEHLLLHQDIRNHYEGSGCFDTIWKSYHVAKNSYSGLLELLNTSPALLTHFLSLRSNYDSNTGDLSVKFMTTDTHDVPVNCMCSNIHARVQEAGRRYPGLSSTTDKIVNAGTGALVSYPDDTVWHMAPDGKFQFLGSRYPPVVIEVGNSQSETSLMERALKFFERTDGAIQLVILLDFEYDASTATDPSIPRTGYVSFFELKDRNDGSRDVDIDTTIEKVMFRNAEGKAMAGKLPLKLGHFIPSDKRHIVIRRHGKKVLGIKIPITFHNLTKWLALGQTIENDARNAPPPELGGKIYFKGKELTSKTTDEMDAARFKDSEEDGDGDGDGEDSDFRLGNRTKKTAKRAKRAKRATKATKATRGTKATKATKAKR